MVVAEVSGHEFFFELVIIFIGKGRFVRVITIDACNGRPKSKFRWRGQDQRPKDLMTQRKQIEIDV